MGLVVSYVSSFVSPEETPTPKVEVVAKDLWCLILGIYLIFAFAPPPPSPLPSPLLTFRRPLDGSCPLALIGDLVQERFQVRARQGIQFLLVFPGYLLVCPPYTLLDVAIKIKIKIKEIWHDMRDTIRPGQQGEV